ncbi:MAG: glycosyltransferase, partial [Ktedonobacterales bacterium]
MQQIDSAMHTAPEVAQVAQGPQTRLGITVVVPVYNEEESIRPLYEALSHQLYQLGAGYEIIFVDDGSRDGSFTVLQALHDADSHVRVVRFRRNFGKT